MSKRVWTVILGLICVIGTAASAWVFLSKDRNGPEISVPEKVITYYADEDTSVLLEGVTAWDDYDGDVTDSLLIEAIYPSSSDDVAKIIYAAIDNSNNVTKAQRLVNYATEKPAEAETTREVDTETEQEEPENETETETGAEVISDARLVVLNATSTSGVATAWKAELESMGYEDIEVGNYDSAMDYSYIYTTDQELAKELQEIFPDAIIREEALVSGTSDVNLSQIDASIIIGAEDAEIETESESESDDNE